MQNELIFITKCIDKIIPLTNYVDYILTIDDYSSEKPYTLRLIYNVNELKYDTFKGQEIWDWLSVNFMDVLITMNKLIGGSY